MKYGNACEFAERLSQVMAAFRDLSVSFADSSP